LDHGDLLVGQLHAAVERGDGRVVPLLDIAEDDVGLGFAVELPRARFDALDMPHRHRAADHRRELRAARLCKFGVLARGSGWAEAKGVRLEWGDESGGMSG